MLRDQSNTPTGANPLALKAAYARRLSEAASELAHHFEESREWVRATKYLQVAAGVPLQIGEGAEFRSFRVGLFGLDKLCDVDGTLARLEHALAKVS